MASPINLSFLDIMFCGFGAVVLLVLILNADTVKARRQVQEELQAQVMRMEQQLEDEEKNLLQAGNSLQATDRELAAMEGKSAQVLSLLQPKAERRARMDKTTLATRADVRRLQSDLLDLDRKNRRLGAEREADLERGRNVRRFLGEGDRQYLTGLKIGGQRILILLDRSASMLDETLVNIIRLRNMSDDARRRAGKWRRALAIVDWLVANLPADSLYQIYTFNVHTTPALADTGRQWLKVSDRAVMTRIMARVHQTLPTDGTSLYHAFAAASAMQPHPDNILLITDGLPTQGKRKPTATKVSAGQRMKHFEEASSQLPAGVPVNSILLPMEGDAYAAAAFWQLAITTRGSFIVPSAEWP